MVTLALGLVGAFVGGIILPGIGASIGFLAFSMLGSLIDPPKLQGPAIGDLRLQRSSYGTMIPIVFGTGRLAGNVIDQTDLVAHKHKHSGKGGPQTVDYTYTVSFDILICKGPILGVRRIWWNARLIWDITSGEDMPCALYLGSADQAVDPTFEAIHGVGNTPAYRHRAHAVFTDYDVTDARQIGQWEFEIFTNVGVFPWRVSHFAPDPDLGTHGYIATYAGGVVTVGEYTTVSGGHYYERQFDIHGVENVSAAYDAALGTPTPSGLFPVKNLLAAASEDGWWSRNVFVVAFTVHPLGGSNQYAVGQNTVYQHDFIYACCKNSISGHVGVARWPALNGVIDVNTGLYASVVDLGVVTLSSVVIGFSNTTNIYISDATLPSVSEYSADLQTLIRTWNLSGVDAVQQVINGAGFTVYQGTTGLILCCDRGNVGGKNAGAFYLNNDLSVTFIGNVATIDGNIGTVLELGRSGYALVSDGIISLIPPPAPVPLSTIVADLSDMTPVTAYDVTELTDLVRWFVVGSQMTVRNALEILRRIFFFDAVESDDVAKFRKRGSSSVATIPDDDLCGRGDGETSPDPLKTINTKESGLPRTVSLTYIDVDTDYQTGEAHSPRQTTLSQNDVTMEVAVGLTNAEANQKCWTIQCTAWMEREAFQWSTTRKWAYLEPCDVVNVRGRVIRILKRTETVVGVVKFEGVLEAPSLYTQNAVGDPGGFTAPTPPAALVNTSLLLLDLPLIKDGDYPNGHYAAVTPASTGAWPGASVQKSTDGGTTYAEVGNTLVADIVGIVATALGNWTGGNRFDESNVLTVVLGPGGGEIDSNNETAVLNGANAWALGSPATGWEIGQSKVATLIAANTYQLTGHLRGRRGTEWMIPLHAAGETLVMLPTSIQINGPTAELGASRKFKAVTLGMTVASAAAQDFTNRGIALQPYPPVQVGGGRVAGSDISIQWARRTRIGGAWIDFTDVPLSQDSEQYYVIVYADGTYASVKRTTVVVSAQTFTYTLAMQTADFGAAQSTVYFDVAQIGSYGIGRATRGIV